MIIVFTLSLLSLTMATAIAVVTASIFLTGCGSGSAGNTVNAAAKDGAADSAGDDSKAAGAKKGTLTVSIGADWFPFLFIDEDDNLAGYDVDVINAVAEKMWNLTSQQIYLLSLRRLRQEEATLVPGKSLLQRKEVKNIFSPKFHIILKMFILSLVQTVISPI